MTDRKSVPQLPCIPSLSARDRIIVYALPVADRDRGSFYQRSAPFPLIRTYYAVLFCTFNNIPRFITLIKKITTLYTGLKTRPLR